VAVGVARSAPRSLPAVRTTLLRGGGGVAISGIAICYGAGPVGTSFYLIFSIGTYLPRQ
jgi:hypothetical protein